MSDDSFEFRLERMFAEVPPAPDADYFALRVLERLDRGWTARRLIIGVMGVLGGLIGGFEILGSGALGQLVMVAGRANDFLSQHVTSALTSSLGLYVDPRLIWYGVAFAVVTAAVGLARLVQEI